MINKFLFFFALSIMILTGCDIDDKGDKIKDNTNKINSNKFELVEDIGYTMLGEDTLIIRDNETKCQYIKSSTRKGYQGYGYFSPYIGSDGKVIGCGETPEFKLSDDDLEVIKEKYNLVENTN